MMAGNYNNLVGVEYSVLNLTSAVSLRFEALLNQSTTNQMTNDRNLGGYYQQWEV